MRNTGRRICLCLGVGTWRSSALTAATQSLDAKHFWPCTTVWFPASDFWRKILELPPPPGTPPTHYLAAYLIRKLTSSDRGSPMKGPTSSCKRPSQFVVIVSSMAGQHSIILTVLVDNGANWGFLGLGRGPRQGGGGTTGGEAL